MMNNTIQDNPPLQKMMSKHINQYLADMKGQDINCLYDMVMEQIEPPLLQAVMEHCRYNQSQAAKVLGISRGTIRTKLKKHFDDKYCGSIEP